MKKSQLLGAVCALVFLSSSAEAALVAYDYDGLVFDTATGNDSGGSPLYAGQSITGNFTIEELAPSSTINLTGSLPVFSFSDGIRSISNGNIVPGPGDITGPTELYADEFTIRTDASGNIEAWWIRFINSSLTNALGTYQNGTGQDSTRLTSGLDGCATGSWSYCNGSVNTNASGTTGTWTATVVPVPAAVWLLGSGLIGLFGFARRKKV